MRIPEAMNDFVPTKVQGGILIHARRIGQSEALCGRTPGQPEWCLFSTTTDLTCPKCIKFCSEQQRVEITPSEAALIFSMAGFADGEGQLRVEDFSLLRKLRDVYPGVWKKYDYIDLGDI